MVGIKQNKVVVELSRNIMENKVTKRIQGIKHLPRSTTYGEMASPVGKLTIVTSPSGLHAVLWDNDRNNREYETIITGISKSENEKTIVQTKLQLDEYFKGKRKIFDLPLVMDGTDFQIRAWNELLKIPYATTISYAQQADGIGNRNKARAVGMANSLNPIAIIIPCHRVIGHNGTLVGFAGGIEKKDYLLKLEKINT